MIITLLMFLLKQSTLSAECDVLDKAALCIQQKCDESALCVQQIDVAKEIRYPEEFRSRYAMFVNCNTSINNRAKTIRSPSRIPVKKLEKLSRKNKKIKKLVCRRILKNIPVSSKMYRYIKCRLRTRSNNDGIKCLQNMRKKWHSTRSTLYRKSSTVIESPWANLYLCIAVIHHQVCTRMRATEVNVQH